MPASNESSIGEVLGALSRECASLADISERIQIIVACAGGNAENGQSFHRDAQACDLLTQSLAAITDFLTVVSQRVPQTWTLDIVDVIRDLPLSDLAAALALRKKETRDSSSDSIEFFS